MAINAHNKAILKKRIRSNKKKAKLAKNKIQAKKSIFDTLAPKLKTASFANESISDKEAQRQTKHSLLPRKKTEKNPSLYAYTKPRFSSVKKPKLTKDRIFDIAKKTPYFDKYNTHLK